MHRTPLLALAAVLLAGCAASSTPQYDLRFGDAVRAARQAMILNPNTASAPGPAQGIEGTRAREAIGRYDDTFKAPPPVVNVINIGGGVAGER